MVESTLKPTIKLAFNYNGYEFTNLWGWPVKLLARYWDSVCWYLEIGRWWGGGLYGRTAAVLLVVYIVLMPLTILAIVLCIRMLMKQ